MNNYIWKQAKVVNKDNKSVQQTSVKMVDMDKDQLIAAYNHCKDMLYNDSKAYPGRYHVLEEIKKQIKYCNIELAVRWFLQITDSDNKIILSDSLGEYDSNMLVHGIDTVVDELNASINLALAAGIEKDKIMIDPGVGFAKDYYMNMAATANLDTFVNMGFPLLLGTSCKSLIGMTLDLPVSERLEGTIATSVMAVMYGCSFVRVHNVKSNKRAITMTEELLKYRV